MKSTGRVYGRVPEMGLTAVIRWTANVRTSSERWSCAVSTPPSTETGSTIRSVRVDGGWLTARDHRADDVRQFAVHRIRTVNQVDSAP